MEAEEDVRIAIELEKWVSMWVTTKEQQYFLCESLVLVTKKSYLLFISILWRNFWAHLMFYWPSLFSFVCLQKHHVTEVKKQEHELLEARSFPLRNYLMKYVMPTVSQGLLESCRAKADDPVDFLVFFPPHMLFSGLYMFLCDS